LQRSAAQWRFRRVEPDPVHLHRPPDVLQFRLPQIVIGDADLPLGVLLYPAGHAYASRLRQGFQPSRDVDPVTVDVLAVDDHIPDVDPDAPLDAALGSDRTIYLSHCPLPFRGAADCINHTGELHQYPIASGFEDPPAVASDSGVD